MRRPADSARAIPPGETRAGSSRSRRFDERFIRKLESLVLAIRRTPAGAARAARRSRRIGAGLEFADHRDYTPGDDPRHLDWSLYGRLERLAVRLYEEDEDLSIDILVDASASMAIGQPSKLDLALQIGAALAYVGLANLDRVAVTPLGAEPTAPAGHVRGKGRIVPLLQQLEEVSATGTLPLSTAVRAFIAGRPARRRGLVVVISDFYDAAGTHAALDLLRHHRMETAAIQVSAAEEIAPALRGDVRVRDIETGEVRDVTLSPRTLAEYAQRHGALLRGLEGYCRERAIPCFTVVSDQAFESVVLRIFRAGGLLR